MALKSRVPHFNVFIVNGTMENSDYTNCTGYLKNCYLICESDYDEDCYYSNLLKQCKDVVDCSVCYECERCYECVDCIGCYDVRYAQNCDHCRDSAFLFDCQACHDCIGCINQRHKQFMIYNVQYSREEYEAKKKAFHLDDYEGVTQLRKMTDEFFADKPHRAIYAEHNENASGNHLFNAKNALECYDSKDLEDCTHCAKLSLKVKNALDYTSWGDNAELVYNSSACGDTIYDVVCSSTCTTNLSFIRYCDQCSRSKHLFGCVGVRDQEYCILNKKYSKQEYEEMVPRIIKHIQEVPFIDSHGVAMHFGDFFPAEACPFGYNETIAMDYFPLTKQAALDAGYTWKDPDPKEFKKQDYIIPAGIHEVANDVLEAVLACETTGKNYKIIERELAFYRDMQIPIPRTCPDQRHLDRMGRRNTPTLCERPCAGCSRTIKSICDYDASVPVYCETCFQEKLYN